MLRAELWDVLMGLLAICGSVTASVEDFGRPNCVLCVTSGRLTLLTATSFASLIII